MMFKEFRIDILGDLEYNELVADIYYKDQFVALLTQEEGFENLKIEIHPPNDQDYWIFELSDFERAIQYARKRLQELRRLPDNET